ncbi:MAG: sulfotransferase domain-containing protein [Candidatus Dojkabacteria bacterium]|nr:sulfotransferase domain-containing protein [Candidatus Dojkabacteria bacterium]MDQ7020220.1 sulfotransferase domain-containing protein [Candidatus Dojkabacteria bacterium]
MNSKKKAIVVLGMHKSGTSMLANLLQLAGVYLGEEENLKGPAYENLFGFFENKEILDINERLLEILGGSWYKLPLFETGWAESDHLNDLYKEAKEILNKLSENHALIGFKEPRTTVLMPFWENVLKENFDIRNILIYRQPREVARSLMQRNKFTENEAIDIWFKYNQIVLDYLELKSFEIIRYEDLLEDAVSYSKYLFDKLKIDYSENVLQEIYFTVSNSLRHSSYSDEDFFKDSNYKQEYKQLHKKLITLDKKLNLSFRKTEFIEDKDLHIKTLEDKLDKIKRQMKQDWSNFENEMKNHGKTMEERDYYNWKLKELEKASKNKGNQVIIASIPIIGQLFIVYKFIKKQLSK